MVSGKPAGGISQLTCSAGVGPARARGLDYGHHQQMLLVGPGVEDAFLAREILARSITHIRNRLQVGTFAA